MAAHPERNREHPTHFGVRRDSGSVDAAVTNTDTLCRP